MSKSIRKNQKKSTITIKVITKCAKQDGGSDSISILLIIVLEYRVYSSKAMKEKADNYILMLRQGRVNLLARHLRCLLQQEPVSASHQGQANVC